ncbi:MAG: hypothetical protein NZM37_12335, partial [Sandaracinaceae bacterium]|nr:hypothetical protein [Sandaracinaceae bacterium]
MSVGAFFLIFGSVAFSFAIEAALGFGATLIALALGVLWIDARLLLPPLVFWNLVLSLCLWWKGRKKVHWGWILKEVTPWMLLGLPVGVFGFRMLPSSLLVRIFGGLVLMLS